MYVNLKISDHIAAFKIDTWTQCNVIPESLCKKAEVKYNSKARAKLISYTRHEIKAVGKTTIAVECKEIYYLVEVQVVDADVIPVLGLQSSTELKLIKRLHTIESDNTQGPEKIMKDYEHLL